MYPCTSTLLYCRWLTSANDRTTTGSACFTHLVYADKTTLLLSTANDASTYLSSFSEAAAPFGLKMSRAETKLQNLGSWTNEQNVTTWCQSTSLPVSQHPASTCQSDLAKSWLTSLTLWYRCILISACPILLASAASRGFFFRADSYTSTALSGYKQQLLSLHCWPSDTDCGLIWSTIWQQDLRTIMIYSKTLKFYDRSCIYIQTSLFIAVAR